MSELALDGNVADGVERKLDPRSIELEQVGGWIFTAAVSSGMLVALVVPALISGRLLRLAVGVVTWAVLSGALALYSHHWPRVAWRHTSYRVDAVGIEIARGVFWRSVLNVPRSRVQHTDVSQGPLERRYGLATLVVYTAGTEHAKVTLPGLPHGRALVIRQHLLPGADADAV